MNDTLRVVGKILNFMGLLGSLLSAVLTAVELIA